MSRGFKGFGTIEMFILTLFAGIGTFVLFLIVTGIITDLAP